MRKLVAKIAVVCAVLVQAVACSNGPKPITIDGGVPSYWNEGDSVVLIQFYTHEGNKVLASTHVLNGKVNFTTTDVTETSLMAVESTNGRGYYEFVASPGDNIVVKWSEREYSVEGSSVNDEYNEQVVKPMDEARKKSSALYMANREMLSKLNGPDADAFKKSAEYKEYLKKSQEVNAECAEDLEKVVFANADKIWAPLLLKRNTYLKPSEEMYAAFSDEVKNSTYGKAVRADLDKMLTGKRVPQFTGKDVDGKLYSVEELMQGNNYLLIDFWASWCGPCRKAIPELKEFAVKYADKGLKIVSISTDKDRDAWIKAMEQEQMPWLQLHDEGRVVAPLFNVRGIPSIHLVRCSDGVVLFENLYGDAVGLGLENELGE